MASRVLGRLRPNTAALFVCDVQEKFRPIIAGFPIVIDTARRMVQGAHVLDIPVLVTEQYPKALGATVSEVAGVLPAGCPVLPKTMFSMCTPEVDSWLKSRPQVKQAGRRSAEWLPALGSVRPRRHFGLSGVETPAGVDPSSFLRVNLCVGGALAHSPP